jgi:hypothetical protein
VTSLKVASLIPDRYTGIFCRLNPYGRTMALGSNQSLNEMNPRDLPFHLHVLIVYKSWELQPAAVVRDCLGL